MASRSDLRRAGAPAGLLAARRGLLAARRRCLAVLLLGGGAFLYQSGHDQIFWYDEWEFLLDRRGGGLSTFLDPHNEHLSLVPIAIYKLLLGATGMDGYGPYRLTLVVLDVLCALLLFVYAERRVGAWLALGAAALFLFLGPAWEVILWPFQIAWVAALAAGLGALLMLDRGDRAGRGDRVGPAARVAGQHRPRGGHRGRRARGGPLALGPARGGCGYPASRCCLYVAWYLGYSESHFSRRTLPGRAGVRRRRRGGLGLGRCVGPGGPGDPPVRERLAWGRPLAVLAVVVLVWRLTRIGTVSPRMAMLLASLVGFWILTAIGRARALPSRPPTPRGTCTSAAAFTLLIAIELLRGVAIGQDRGDPARRGAGRGARGQPRGAPGRLALPERALGDPGGQPGRHRDRARHRGPGLQPGALHPRGRLSGRRGGRRLARALARRRSRWPPRRRAPRPTTTS